MTKMRLSAATGLLCVLLPAASAAQKAVPPAAPAKPAPDVIVFTNGDQLSGTLVRGVGNTIVFKSDMAGEITVSTDKVKELRSSGSFALLRKDVPPSRKNTQTGTVSFADGNVTVASPTGEPEIVPVKNMSYLIDQTTYDKELERRAGFLNAWNGTITGGATLVRATNTANTYTAGIALVRAIPTVPFLPPRNRTSIALQETYGKQTSPGILSGEAPDANGNYPDVITKTNILHAGLERDQYVSTQFYALGQVSFDHNYSQGLDLQAVYGAGIGWTPIKSAREQLDVKADMHYETQQFFSLTPGVAPAQSQNLVGSTFSEAYRRNLPRKLIFTQTLNLLPAWNNLNAYSGNGSINLAMPVFKRLGLQFTTSDSFLNNPSPGFKKNSYQFVTGVTYSLR